MYNDKICQLVYLIHLQHSLSQDWRTGATCSANYPSTNKIVTSPEQYIYILRTQVDIKLLPCLGDDAKEVGDGAGGCTGKANSSLYKL